MALALVGAVVVMGPSLGSMGFRYSALDRPFAIRVDSVPPHSSAAGHLWPGDRIDLRALPASDRYWLASQIPHRAGYAFVLPVERRRSGCNNIERVRDSRAARPVRKRFA